MQRRPPYDLVAFDVDGTLVDDTVFVWQTLHEYFGTDPAQREGVAREYFAGRISYRDWFEHDLKVLREQGADLASIQLALADLKPMPGARETLETLRSKGLRLAVISGSLNVVIDWVFPGFTFDDVFINRLFFDDTGVICAWEPTPYDVDHKGGGLRALVDKHDLALERCVFVGDHFNDVSVARIAGLSIAFNCKSDELARVSDVVVTAPDLRQILPHILG